jgi:hypothetical protein
MIDLQILNSILTKELTQSLFFKPAQQKAHLVLKLSSLLFKGTLNSPKGTL